MTSEYDGLSASPMLQCPLHFYLHRQLSLYAGYERSGMKRAGREEANREEV